jgi:SNF2 family DNA or RNA helicase
LTLIFHGTWHPELGGMVLWAEDTTLSAENPTPDSRSPGYTHPYAASIKTMLTTIGTMARNWDIRTLTLRFPLHGVHKVPCPSPEAEALGVAMPFGRLQMNLWEVPALTVNPWAMPAFFQWFPQAKVQIASDLWYWYGVYRRMLQYLQKGRFLPDLLEDSDDGRYSQVVDAGWTLYPDTVERDQMVLAMPGVSPLMLSEQGEYFQPVDMLQHFWESLADQFVRSNVGNSQAVGSPWVRALVGTNSEITYYQQAEAKRMVNAWKQKIVIPQSVAFCLRLDEPVTFSESWRLNYLLRPYHDSTTLIEAESIWDESSEVSRQLDFRRSYLIRVLIDGLRQAASHYEPIARSLRESTPSSIDLTLEEAYTFLMKASQKLSTLGLVVLVPDWWAQRAAQLRARVSMRSSNESLGFLSGNSLFNYEWKVTLGDQTVSREEFEQLVALKQPLVQIQGKWIEIDERQIEAARQFFEQQPEAGTTNLLGMLQLSADAKGDSATGFEVETPDIEPQLQKMLKKLRTPDKSKAVKPPTGLEATLRPYQERGVAWLAQMRELGMGACLADDMGLGKTIQAIALWLHERQQMKIKGTVLVVCPSSVIANWGFEIERFAPELTVHLHHGAARLKKEAFIKQVKQVDVIITSYVLLQRDVETMKQVQWAGVVLDEAQNIKNPSTKMAQAARTLQAGHRIAMTGTPIENRLSELWSIFQFLNPGYLGSHKTFTSRFATPIEKHQNQTAAKTLRQLVAPFILRRMKSDPAIIKDLPDKLEYKVHCSLTVEQASLYEAVVRREMDLISNAESPMERRGAILRMLIRLKQVCDHPVLFAHQDGELADRSGKLMRLGEMLAEVRENGESALVFTQFAKMGSLLQRYLHQHLQEEVLYLHGGTPVVARPDMVKAFQKPDGPPVFVLSLKAGGSGLNLTRATHVFHYDRWYNPAVEDQATDRAYRIGQTQQVQVHKLICLGTLEERIDALIEHKKWLTEQVIGSGENWISELNDTELRDLVMLRRIAVEG